MKELHMDLLDLVPHGKINIKCVCRKGSQSVFLCPITSKAQGIPGSPAPWTELQPGERQTLKKPKCWKTADEKEIKGIIRKSDLDNTTHRRQLPKEVEISFHQCKGGSWGYYRSFSGTQQCPVCSVTCTDMGTNRQHSTSHTALVNSSVWTRMSSGVMK